MAAWSAPKNIKPYLDRAEGYVQSGQTELAIGVLLEGLAQHPNNPVLRNNLGVQYANSRHMAAAVNEFLQAARLPTVGGAAPASYPAEPLQNLKAALWQVGYGVPTLPARYSPGELEGLLEDLTGLVAGDVADIARPSFGVAKALFPVLYLAPMFTLFIAMGTGAYRVQQGASVDAATQLSRDDLVLFSAIGSSFAVVWALYTAVRAFLRQRRRQWPFSSIKQLLEQQSVEPSQVIAKRFASWEPPDRDSREPFPVAAELPSALREFLKVWFPFHTEAMWRPLGQDHPLWTYVPKIAPTGRRFGAHHTLRWEGVFQFVTFWNANGKLAHPAVDATVLTERGRAEGRGQTVREAFARKGATWITRLTLVGAFRTNDLVNLTRRAPDDLMRPAEPILWPLPDGPHSYRPFAILETFKA
jgi:hypothetical protein